MKDEEQSFQSIKVGSAADNEIDSSLLETVPILTDLGISVVEVAPSRAILKLTVNETNVGPYGAVLGAALISAADMAACIAAVSTWRGNGDERIGGFATQEFSSSFCRSARVGPVLINAVTQYSSERRAVVNFLVQDGGRDDIVVMTGTATIIRH
ncbi:MAG: hypothetical protein OXI18_02040 [bacterium]|nr:hypothetical protein [bacterium]